MRGNPHKHIDRWVSTMSFPEALIVAIKTLWDAFKRTWIYMLFGIALGAGCSVLSGLLPAQSSIGALLTHLSHGFFVSSIAVLFYEWGSDAKHALDLSHQLDDLLRTKGEEAIALGMEAMFPDRKELREKHARLIDVLNDLNSPLNRGRDADVAFLALFVNHAARYGEQLRTLRDHLAEPGDEVGRPFHLDFTKMAYADNVLTNWMKLLGEGDSYVTLSNARTWSALKSGGFKKAGREAVVKGAHIRRIFVMGGEEQYSSDDIRNLIEHYQFAANRKEQGSGSYRIQIADPEVFQPRKIKPENQHYGIFTARFARQKNGRDADKTSVAFKVIGTEVENFELLAVAPDGELARNFEEIWESLELSKEGPIIGPDGKPTGTGPARFLDAVMSREVRMLTAPNQMCTMEIVSTIESWRKPSLYELPRFYEATAGFEVRHMFVLDRHEQRSVVQELAKTLSRGAEQAPWEVKIIDATQVADRRQWLAPHWRIIDKDGKPLHQCVFTLNCKPDLSDFFLTRDDAPMKAAGYARNFSEVWPAAEPL